MDEKKYFIYTHSTSDGIVRYVGKGIQKKGKNGINYQRSRSKKGRNDDWWALFPSGIPSKIEIVEDNIPQELANETENNWIVKIGMIKDGGTLINRQLNTAFMTDKERNHLVWEKNKDKLKLKSKIYREKNREKLLEKKRLFYLEKKEKILEKQKNNYQKYKDNYKKKYRELNPKKNKRTREEILLYNREYYKKNRERLNEAAKLNSKLRYQKRKELKNEKDNQPKEGNNNEGLIQVA